MLALLEHVWRNADCKDRCTFSAQHGSAMHAKYVTWSSRNDLCILALDMTLAIFSCLPAK